MGHDTRLIIGQIQRREWNDPDGTYVRELAAVDLAVAGSNTHTGHLLAKARNEVRENFWFYGLDGSTHVTKDGYGALLTAVDRHELVEAMRKDNAKSPYRRFLIALALLESFDNEKMWPSATDNIVVLQYGH